MTRVIYTIILIVISILHVRAKSCNILENMLCECHSSFNGETEQLICNNYKSSMFTDIQLTNETKANSRSFDSIHLTLYDHEFNVSSMFLKDLSNLFPRVTSSDRGENKLTMKIVLAFPNFNQLHFEDYAFYQLFGNNPHYTTIFTLELTSNGKITYSSMAFNQLTVDQMFLHASSFEPYSFEEIFNNTNIGELTLEGSTPRSNETYRANFNGKIRLAKFTKMVDTVSSEEFPAYPVRSMDIEAHEPRKINASTFMNYRNLHGIHLIRPKFFFDNRTFNGFQYLISLEIVELDGETIKDNTFKHVPRIRYFTLGQNTRYLSEHALDHLDYLVHFDASKLILDQLYPSSRCVLARFIQKQKKINPSIMISPPQAEYCDCIHDFILTILDKQAQQSYTDSCSENKQERCQLSQCNVVRNFHFPINKVQSDEQSISSLDENMISTTVTVDLMNDDVLEETHQSPSYVHKHPPVHHQSKTNNKYEPMESSKTDIQASHVSALKVNKPIDPNDIAAYDYDENVDSTAIIDSTQTNSIEDEKRRLALKNEALKWIALILVCITILCALLVGTIIWFFSCRSSQRNYKAGFQPVQPNPAHV